MKVNDKQIGGDHYKAGYQHWDFAVKSEIGYLLGCATKYVFRWRKKNGAQDLEKAIHYIEKFVEMNTLEKSAFSSITIPDKMRKTTHDFLKGNKNLLWADGWIIYKIVTAEFRSDFIEVIEDIKNLIEKAPSEEHPFGYDKEQDAIPTV